MGTFGPRSTASFRKVVNAAPARWKSRIGPEHPSASEGAYDVSEATKIVNEMVVRAYYERVINGRNGERATTTHAPDWVGHFRVGASADLHGRAANLWRLASLADEYPRLRIHLSHVRTVRDLVIVRFHVTGHRLDGESAGFAVHRLVNGRIVDEHVVNRTLARHAEQFARRLDGDRLRPTAG